MKKLIEQINNLNTEELNEIVRIVKQRRNTLHYQNANKLNIGDRVSFEGKFGRTEKATVEKVKIKYVLVRTDTGQRWNVPGSHLTLIKEAVDA